MIVTLFHCIEMVNGRKLLLLLQVSLVPPGCADELGVGGGGGANPVIFKQEKEPKNGWVKNEDVTIDI